MGRSPHVCLLLLACAVVAVSYCAAEEEAVEVSATSGAVHPTTTSNSHGRVLVPWAETSAPVGSGSAVVAPCTADSMVPAWETELLELHRSTYPETAAATSSSNNKRLVGVAMSAAPRPNGEHYHTVLESLPAWLPVLFHSRLNSSLIEDPQICAEVRATPVYPQLQEPSKLNRFVKYRATRANDKIERTVWRSQIVLDVARTLSEAKKHFHYVLYVEDDVALSPRLFEKIPELIRGRIRMDIPELYEEDKAAGKTDYLTFFHKDPQDHKYANGDPWVMLWLSRQGMLATLWDGRFLDEAVEAMHERFDEKPVDWLVRQIKHDKGWNTPNLGATSHRGFVNHLGKQSTFKSDKRVRAVGSI